MRQNRMPSATVLRNGKATKADSFAGEQLFVGLNCFEPGQAQHGSRARGADKFYYVLSGRARLTVGEETLGGGRGRDASGRRPECRTASREALERTVLLVGIAPPPR